MTFTLSLLLIPYAIFLLAFALFGLINIANLLRYGGATLAGFLATFLFLGAAALIIFISYQNLAQFDWQQTVSIFNKSDFMPESFNF